MQILKCGHFPNDKTKDDKPFCVRCAPNPDSYILEEIEIDMTRMAECTSCENKESISNYKYLAFFEYRGPGSYITKHQCKNCGYYDVAHDKPHVRKKCKEFSLLTEGLVDIYFCGCTGWD